MAERTNGNFGAAGRAPGADRPASVRNVVLVGQHGSGKTTLVETLALATGAITRAGRCEDGTTVSDFDEIEHRRHRSVQLSVVPVEHDGIKINLIDTPGYADFVGELRAGLRAADAALFVVSAADGISGATRSIWDECAAVGMPRAIVVTRLEAARAEFDEMIEDCAQRLGGDAADAVLPLYLPLYGADAGGPEGHHTVDGLIGLLTRRVFDCSSGTQQIREPDEAQAALIEEARNRLIEGIIEGSEDESLMDRYLGGEAIDPKTLIEDMKKAVAGGIFHPVMAAAPAAEGAKHGVGALELLELIVEGFPPPSDRAVPEVTDPDGSSPRRLACDPAGPLVAEVIRTATDPYVGRISLMRVFSGTLTPDLTVHVCGHGMTERGHKDHDADERIGSLAIPFGKQQLPLEKVVAGDICTVAKLTSTETGDTVSAKEQPLLMAPWTMPDPLLPVAVRAHSKADEDKLAQGLARLVAEDPTLRLEQNPETHQLVLWCMGEAHVEVLMERLASRYGVEVDAVPYRVALRETFSTAAQGRGRHVKQSGGHGQYAICEINVEPLPNGSGIEFVDKVVGGAVPRQFIPSVEKGVRAQCERGVATGCPVVDVRVTLFDGKAHSVDSSDAAFQMAGALALKAAAEQARIDLLEPVAEVRVLVSDEYVGPVMTDLAGRRGRVLGTEPVGV
ncbi:elongation factor G, partial [Mangrovactinospora gilvigrisea]